jgi:hypothetical protein
MRASAAVRSPAARSLGGALITLAIAVALVSVMQFAAYQSSPASPAWVVDLFTVTGLVYAAAGLVAWWRRPSNGLGMIMVGGALSWLAVALFNTGLVVLDAAGFVLSKLPLAVVVHILLAFPSGRLQTRAARWTTTAAYIASVALQVPLYLFAPRSSPGGLLAVTSNPALASAGFRVQAVAGVSVMVVTALILASRLRQAPAAARRVLLPLDVYGIAALLLFPLTAK